MQCFEKFLAERGYMIGYNHDYQKAYDYGAQSRQAEIDELKKRIDEALNELDDRYSKEYIINKLENILIGETK